MHPEIRLLFLILFLFLFGSIAAQGNKEKSISSPTADSLERVLTTQGMDTTRVVLLNTLATELITKGEYQQAIGQLDQAITLAKKLNYKKGLANAYQQTGAVNWYQGNFENALKIWLSGQKIWEELNDKHGIAISYSNIAMISGKQKNYTKAFENYALSLKIAEQINDKRQMAKTYLNIGDTYSGKGFSDENKDVKKSSYALALDNIMKGMHLMEELGDKQVIAHFYTNAGNVYYNQGNIAATKAEANSLYKKDLEYQFKALQIKEEIGDKQGVAVCYASLGIVYDIMGDLKKSGDYLEKYLFQSKEIGYKTGIKEAYADLSQLAEEQGDYKKALAYHKLFSSLKDSLLNERSTELITEMETKYQSEKKQKENEVLTQKNQLLDEQSKLQDLKIKQSRYFIAGLLFLLLLIIGFAFLYIQQNRTKALYAKIELEQKLLRSQMNPHFIFNAMMGIQNYIYKEEPEIAANYLSSVVQLMRSIIDNSKKEFVPLEKEIATLHHYLTLQKVRFTDKFNFKIVIDPNLDTVCTLIPPMMAQPFIENAIVHGIMPMTNGEGMITVTFTQKNNDLLLEIEDNGIGREKAKENSSKENTHLHIATNITEERLAALNRRSKNKNSMVIIDLKNKAGEAAGTKVRFLFPFNKENKLS